jgi:hypothetical protein
MYTDPPLPAHFPSPLRTGGWAALLSEHPDRTFGGTLLHIIQYGARFGYCGFKQSIVSLNLASGLANLSLDVAKQLSQGRIMLVSAHTLANWLAPPLIRSPLGLLPKENGGRRRIHRLSYPPGSSRNDHIPS